MCEREKPPSKIAASIHSQVLDYYNKFGQDRDLKRYLRLRENYSKSSSEGSISTPSCASRVPSRESKSLDQLNFVKETSSEEEDVRICPRAFELPKAFELPRAAVISEPMVQPEIKVTTKKSVVEEAKKTKKSYTFNCESNIEISLPLNQAQAVSMPELIPRPETSTEYSQTDFEEQLNAAITADENSAPEKLPEAAKKASKRLEWDSLGDVGYDKNSSLCKKQSRSMSTLEKSILKEFFADKGIEITFKTDSKKFEEKLQKTEEEIADKSKQGAIPKTPREKWRETLANIKQKYTKNRSNLSNASQRDLSQFKKLPTDQHSTPKVEILEKCIQTSFVKTQTKEVQVDFSNTGSMRSAVDAGSITSPSSFEYFPNSKEATDKENVSPKTLSKEHERKIRQSAKKLLSGQRDSQKNLDGTTDVELGMRLLCSLIQSKSLNDRQKKSLARKIVAKITKSSLPLSETSTTNSSVGSRPSLIKSAKRLSSVQANANDAPIKSDSSSRMGSTLSRPTSEDSRNIETSRKLSKCIERVSISHDDRESEDQRSSVPSGADREGSSEDHPQSSVVSGVQGESSEGQRSSVPSDGEKTKSRESTDKQSTKSSKEDENTVEVWLEPLTKSEVEYNRRKGSSEKTDKEKPIDVRAGGDNAETDGTQQPDRKLLKFFKDEKKSHLKWIENEIERLENLKHLLLINDDTQKPIEKITFPQNIVTYPVHIENVQPEGTAGSSVSNPSSSGTTAPEDNPTYEVHRTDSEVEVINPTLNYRRTVRRISEEVHCEENDEGERSKPVKTTKFSVEEEQRFPKKSYVCSNYEKVRKEERSKLETPKSGGLDSIRSYAKQRKQEFLKQYGKNRVRLYDQPAESDHYSEPKDTCVKRPFHTNAYTSVTSSDFFVSSGSVSIPISVCSSSITTTHQYDNRVAVGVQTTDSILRTQPIYTTRFACGCVNYCCCQVPRATIREYRPRPSKQVQAVPAAMAYVITFEEGPKKSEAEPSRASTESLTLQEHLEKKRPDFQQNTIERQCVLKKLQGLRNQRDAKVREIIENTSMNSIPRKLKNLPPPPTKYTRIFPTREMKAMTKRKYSKLPEVLDKVERDKKERRKRSNKVLADMFNRRLQRRVHKGKLELEHSQTVI